MSDVVQLPVPGTASKEPGAEAFRLLVDSVRDYAIFLLDLDGRVKSWNVGAERTKGYSAPEILGESFTRFYTPEDRARGTPQALLRRAAEEGRAEAEGWRVRKDGTCFWADVVITALRDPRGQLTGFAKVTRDLTERRRVEEELRRAEERFRLLVERVVDYAIFMLAPDGRVITWNVGGERIYGYRAPEILGAHLSQLHPPEDAEHQPWERELESAQRDGRFECEGWRVRKDGTRFWAEVVVTVLRGAGGELLGFSKVTRDLSERVRLEQERLRAATAQEGLRMRDEFLSVASHELKTPLTALQLDFETLMGLVGDVSAERVTRQLERALRGVRRMGELVGTLLDVSRLSAGQFELRRERCDLALTVSDVVARLAPQARRSGTELTAKVEGPVAGQWDRLRLEQVVTNLVTNALRHAPRTPVAVALRARGGAAVLTVEDGGPGIRDELMPHLFERFTQGPAARQLGGLGLGLYITRHIAEAHGGTVTAANRASGGAVFTVTLPLEGGQPGA